MTFACQVSECSIHLSVQALRLSTFVCQVMAALYVEFPVNGGSILSIRLHLRRLYTFVYPVMEAL